MVLFDVNLPKPFWGPGIYTTSDKLYVRGTISYTLEDKESLPLKDIEKRDSESKSKDDRDIKYTIPGKPFSGSIDVFYKKFSCEWGGRLVFGTLSFWNFLCGNEWFIWRIWVGLTIRLFQG
jgi:hypothetical protein